MTDERMNEQELAAYRTRLCGGGAPLDAEEGFAVADEVTRARLRESTLEARAEAAESEVAQLRATLAASFGLDAKVEANTAALVERVRELDAKLSAAICDHCDEVEAWQSATGLEVGGDPGGVTPEHLRRFIQAQDERVRRLEEALRGMVALHAEDFGYLDKGIGTVTPKGRTLLGAQTLLKEPTP